jgi:hypothetical protein
VVTEVVIAQVVMGVDQEDQAAEAVVTALTAEVVVTALTAEVVVTALTAEVVVTVLTAEAVVGVDVLSAARVAVGGSEAVRGTYPLQQRLAPPPVLPDMHPDKAQALPALRRKLPGHED